jgi:hypothetical protein
MPTASNALLQYEAGQTYKPSAVMTDSGDHLAFTLSGSSIWSERDSFAPVITPNGLVNGGTIIPTDTVNTVSVSNLTCFLAGVLTTVPTDDLTVTRGSSTDTFAINSVTVDTSGALTIVTGTFGTSFSETRGAAGGPPFLPTTSIEIGQVRLSDDTAATVSTNEIFTVVGSHQERYDFPMWEIQALGSRDRNAFIQFESELSLIHSDDSGTTKATKKVYGQVYTPIFSSIRLASDFKVPEKTHSTSSKQVYDGKNVTTSSTSLGQGGFTAYLDDGVNDALVKLKNEHLTFKFFPNKTKEPYLLTAGKLGVARTWPASDVLTATCTISAENEAVEKG